MFLLTCVAAPCCFYNPPEDFELISTELYSHLPKPVKKLSKEDFKALRAFMFERANTTKVIEEAAGRSTEKITMEVNPV